MLVYRPNIPFALICNDSVMYHLCHCIINIPYKINEQVNGINECHHTLCALQMILLDSV